MRAPCRRSRNSLTTTHPMSSLFGLRSSIFHLRSSVFLLALAPIALLSQSPAKFEFTIKNMMRGPEVYGREPAQIRWTPDGQWIYFQWLPPGSLSGHEPKPYRFRAQAGAKPELVPPAQADSVGPLIADGSFSDRKSTRLNSSHANISYAG